MAFLDALHDTTSIKICEHARLLDVASAMLGQEIEQERLLRVAACMLGQQIEEANKYSIRDKLSGRQLFYAVEQTDCLTMQLKQCLGECAAWHVDILWTGHGGADKVMHMSRDWTCTCCCLNRPTVYVTDRSGQQLGQLSDPCKLCNTGLEAQTPDGETIFYANGGCCQLGVCCPLPCGPCSKVEYEIQDTEGIPIGLLTKKVPGICRFCFAPDVDNYLLFFGESEVWADPMHKALMISMAILMDFRYFSENPNDEDDGRVDSVADGDMTNLYSGE